MSSNHQCLRLYGLNQYKWNKKLLTQRGEQTQESIENQHLNRQLILKQQRVALAKLEQAKNADEFKQWGLEQTQKLALTLGDEVVVEIETLAGTDILVARKIRLKTSLESSSTEVTATA